MILSMKIRGVNRIFFVFSPIWLPLRTINAFIMQWNQKKLANELFIRMVGHFHLLIYTFGFFSNAIVWFNFAVISARNSSKKLICFSEIATGESICTRVTLLWWSNGGPASIIWSGFYGNWCGHNLYFLGLDEDLSWRLRTIQTQT